MLEKKKKTTTIFVTFFDGFVAKKVTTIVIAFCDGFATKKVMTEISSPSSMVGCCEEGNGNKLSSPFLFFLFLFF
jgi:hypothetical protein